MADKTGIEWTDATWNPLRGCSRVSEGCRHCYAEGVAGRFSGPGLPYEGLIAKGGQWNGQIKLVPDLLDQPLRWKKPRLIFVNSMSDLFHENVPTEYIDKVFAVMAMAHWHTFQVLTKRPERMRAYFADLKKSFERGFNVCSYFSASDEDIKRIANVPQGLPNVWLGVSVEDQAAADERIPMLLETPAAVRWVSAEPLLGPVDIGRWLEPTGVTCMDVCPDDRFVDKDGHEQIEVNGCMEPICRHCGLVATWTGYDDGLDWVVVGGESGKDARPMHPEWARSLRDQCAAAGVPFLFKQWGEWVPRSSCYHTFEDGSDLASIDPGASRWPCVRLTERGHNGRSLAHSGEGDHAYMQRIGKKAAGRLLDGMKHDRYPEVTA